MDFDTNRRLKLAKSFLTQMEETYARKKQNDTTSIGELREIISDGGRSTIQQYTKAKDKLEAFAAS